MRHRTRSRPSSAPNRAADPVGGYARAVISGRIATNSLVKQACARHFRDISTGKHRGLRYSATLARWAIQFFRNLSHSKGQWAGHPFELAPWQAFIIGSLYGWRRADGTRRFRTAYIEIPRKNGKSTLAAGLALLLGFFDDEPGAEVYTTATKKDQARIVFEEARRMVLRSRAIQGQVVAKVNVLHDAALTGCKLEPLGADSDSLDGLNIHGAIVDELHAHKTRGMVDVLETGTGSRRQPLIFYITTAGFDRESVCWEHHQFAAMVLDSAEALDDTLFAFIAGADPGDDWQDPAVWTKANPNLGVSVMRDDLERKVQRAKDMPGAVNAFRRLHLCEWTEVADRWLELAVWDKGRIPVDRAALRGRPCVAGLDLASTLDTTALVLIFPDGAGGIDVLPWFWIPDEGLRLRVRRDRVPYDVWRDQGLLEVTPGNVTDYSRVKARIVELLSEFDLREITFDPWQATQLAGELQADGAPMVAFRQGFASMAAPTRELERLILDGKVRHGGHPILRWQASNVAVAQDAAGNMKPDKARSRDRIDGVVALIMALGRLGVVTGPGSAYSDHRLMVI